MMTIPEALEYLALFLAIFAFLVLVWHLTPADEPEPDFDPFDGCTTGPDPRADRRNP